MIASVSSTDRATRPAHIEIRTKGHCFEVDLDACLEKEVESQNKSGIGAALPGHALVGRLSRAVASPLPRLINALRRI